MSISEHRRLIERGAFDLLLKEVDIMRGSVPHGDRSVPVVWEQASWLTFRTSLQVGFAYHGINVLQTDLDL